MVPLGIDPVEFDPNGCAAIGSWRWPSAGGSRRASRSFWRRAAPGRSRPSAPAARRWRACRGSTVAVLAGAVASTRSAYGRELLAMIRRAGLGERVRFGGDTDDPAGGPEPRRRRGPALDPARPVRGGGGRGAGHGQAGHRHQPGSPGARACCRRRPAGWSRPTIPASWRAHWGWPWRWKRRRPAAARGPRARLCARRVRARRVCARTLAVYRELVEPRAGVRGRRPYAIARRLTARPPPVLEGAPPAHRTARLVLRPPSRLGSHKFWLPPPSTRASGTDRGHLSRPDHAQFHARRDRRRDRRGDRQEPGQGAHGDRGRWRGLGPRPADRGTTPASG